MLYQFLAAGFSVLFAVNPYLIYANSISV